MQRQVSGAAFCYLKKQILLFAVELNLNIANHRSILY